MVLATEKVAAIQSLYEPFDFPFLHVQIWDPLEKGHEDCYELRAGGNAYVVYLFRQPCPT